jgi:hypothetical protein
VLVGLTIKNIIGGDVAKCDSVPVTDRRDFSGRSAVYRSGHFGVGLTGIDICHRRTVDDTVWVNTVENTFKVIGISDVESVDCRLER